MELDSRVTQFVNKRNIIQLVTNLIHEDTDTFEVANVVFGLLYSQVETEHVCGHITADMTFEQAEPIEAPLKQMEAYREQITHMINKCTLDMLASKCDTVTVAEIYGIINHVVPLLAAEPLAELLLELILQIRTSIIKHQQLPLSMQEMITERWLIGCACIVWHAEHQHNPYPSEYSFN